MRKLIIILTILTVAASLPACVATPVGPGLIYTNVKAPLEATGATDASTKVGRADAIQILGLVAFGDASIERAAKAAGITKIHHIDYRGFTILGIYSKFEIYVYGE